MKKETPKIQVIRMMSKGDIENLGGNIWLRETKKTWITIAFICLAWMIAWAFILPDGIYSGLLMGVPVMFIYLFWIVRSVKAGRKLWNEIKDKEQPVDLG